MISKRLSGGFVFALIVVSLAIVGVGCSGTSNDPGVGGADISQLPANQQMIEYAARGDIQGMQNVLASNPKVINTRSGPHRWTPLHMAAANGQKKAVDFLLQNGANPRIEDEDGYTADQIAAQNMHNDIAKIIEDAMASAPAPGAAAE
ncbi:MAG TPA: ankyrin repeat domain-containing protein [Candidatus Hydrogenedentes bacterium]|nr:ankyrin repeat domain-containing protein [Candidatus Hydrogenedentota bacterium]HPO85975.1 ankyrin repeat domain-containing protein [Candidatus Hydrogenedentota bacterium]